MKKLHSSFFTLALATLMFSCKKEDSSSPSTPVPAVTLKKIVQDDINYVSLDYNGQGQVSRLKSVTDAMTSEATFTYTAEGKPQQATVTGYKVNFKYLAGMLDKIEYVESNDATNTVVSYIKFNYTADKLFYKTGYTKQGDNFVFSSKSTYQYYPNGDLKTIVNKFSIDGTENYQLIDRTEYEYDIKINPLAIPGEISYALYLNPSVHNVTKETVYDQDDQLDETNTYQYSYNAANVPVTSVQTTTYPNSPTIIKNMTYNYL